MKGRYTYNPVREELMGKNMCYHQDVYCYNSTYMCVQFV